MESFVVLLAAARNANKHSKEAGFTLTELLAVLVLLALIATVAIPERPRGASATLELATVEIAGALRFARSEAIRTSTAFGVQANIADQTVSVYRLQPGGGATPIMDVRNPATGQLYVIAVGDGKRGPRLDEFVFKFAGASAPTDNVQFSPGLGVPRFEDNGSIYLLEAGSIVLSQEEAQLSVNLSPMTGRVVVE